MHRPVLVREVLSYWFTRPEGVYLDMTLGGGGHTKALLELPAFAGTVGDYLKAQDTAIYIEMADRWIEFVSDVELLPLPDKPVTSVAFHMLVYSPDTPPAASPDDLPETLEDRFQLRLATAKRQLPRFLRTA